MTDTVLPTTTKTEVNRDRLGRIFPGDYDITAPIWARHDAPVMPSPMRRNLNYSDYHFGDYHVILHPADGCNGVELDGDGALVSGVEVVGGAIGFNVRDGAKHAHLVDCRSSATALPGIWVGTGGERNLIERVFVAGSGDNGLQIEGSSGLVVRNCAFVGPFGNKAIDSSHGEPRDVLLLHVTVLDSHGYGAGLYSWVDGRNLRMAFSLVVERSTGAGASGYGIAAPGITGPAAFRSILFGTISNGPTPGERRVDLGPEDLRGGSWSADSWSDLYIVQASAWTKHVVRDQVDSSLLAKYDAVGTLRDPIFVIPGAMAMPPIG